MVDGTESEVLEIMLIVPPHVLIFQEYDMSLDAWIQLATADLSGAFAEVVEPACIGVVLFIAADRCSRLVLGRPLHETVRLLARSLAVYVQRLDALRRSPRRQSKPGRIATGVDVLMYYGMSIALAVEALGLIVMAGLSAMLSGFTGRPLFAWIVVAIYALVCCWFSGIFRAEGIRAVNRYRAF